MSKFIIFKADPNKWKPALASAIDKDQYPAFFGGELQDPDGNPRYTTKVSPTGYMIHGVLDPCSIRLKNRSRSKFVVLRRQTADLGLKSSRYL